MKVLFTLILWVFVIASTQAEDVEDRFTFESYDTNGDGVLSEEEAAQIEGIEGNWKQADADGNARLDPVEFSAFVSRNRFVPPDDDELPALGAAPFSTADVSQ